MPKISQKQLFSDMRAAIFTRICDLYENGAITVEVQDIPENPVKKALFRFGGFKDAKTMNNSTINLRERIAGLIAPSLVEKRDLALRQANTDALTGIANRAAFDLALPEAMRDGFIFILFDCNNFGKVNKDFGHSYGDKILRDYAGLLQTVATNFKARLFRLGGDEFVIIAPARFAELIRDKAERSCPELKLPGYNVSISGSIGRSTEEADSKLQSRKHFRKEF